MSLNFFNFSCELRNEIYRQLLLQEKPIDPSDKGHRPQITTGLFRANKTVHREATSFFYAQNCFNFCMQTPKGTTTFLEQIGPNNAKYIRHIYIDFPEFHHLDPDHVTLEDDSVRILAKIQSVCVNLATLTTSRSSTIAMECRLDALNDRKIAREALKLVATRFRAISSLQEIIVEVSEYVVSDYARREMKSHEWTISAMRLAEESESEWSLSDIEGDDHY